MYPYSGGLVQYGNRRMIDMWRDFNVHPIDAIYEFFRLQNNL